MEGVSNPSFRESLAQTGLQNSIEISKNYGKSHVAHPGGARLIDNRPLPEMSSVGLPKSIWGLLKCCGIRKLPLGCFNTKSWSNESSMTTG